LWGNTSTWSTILSNAAPAFIPRWYRTLYLILLLLLRKTNLPVSRDRESKLLRREYAEDSTFESTFKKP